MYTRFNLSDIKIGEINIGKIEVETRYKISEVSEIYSLTRKILKEVPEIIDDIKKGGLKAIEVKSEIDELFKDDIDYSREYYSEN